MKVYSFAAASFAALTLAAPQVGAQAQTAAAAQKPPAAAPAGNVENGKKLFTSHGCYQCHGYQGQGGAAGPRIAPRPLPFPALSKYVRTPTGQMPPYTDKVLSETELADIYAFMQSIPAPPAVDSIPLLK